MALKDIITSIGMKIAGLVGLGESSTLGLAIGAAAIVAIGMVILRGE
jgi:hypothetical protein